MRRLRRVLVGLVGLYSFVGVASAHRVTQDRFEAPLPLPLLFVGAAVTVALTAAWLALSDRSGPDSNRQRVIGTISPTVATALRIAGRVGFATLVAGVLAHGLVGRAVPAENLATLFVWSVWLKGLALVSVVVGSPWRVLSPWRGLYDLLCWVEGRDIALLGRYPSWLASWPAVTGFVLGVGIVENFTVVPRSPRLTVVFVVGYTLAMVLGGVAFGRDWFERADTLEVLYGLFGRVAPLQFQREGAGGYTVVVRPPWRGCSRAVSDSSLAVFVVAAVYTVSFDGFTETQLFRSLALEAMAGSGLGAATGPVLYLAGLCGFVLSYVVAVLAVERVATGGSTAWPETMTGFAGSVVPIATAYEVAHNYPFVARSLGGLLSVCRDLLLGEGQAVTLLGWLPLGVFWWSQVALVVGGHVVAVVAAHRVAAARYDTPRRARRGHFPLVVVMVGYTVLSLWIVSQPIST